MKSLYFFLKYFLLLKVILFLLGVNLLGLIEGDLGKIDASGVLSLE